MQSRQDTNLHELVDKSWTLQFSGFKYEQFSIEDHEVAEDLK